MFAIDQSDIESVLLFLKKNTAVLSEFNHMTFIVFCETFLSIEMLWPKV